jgi:hypothetical protein
MAIVQYCTPEWLEVCAKNYQESAKLQKAFEKLDLKVCFLIRSEPEWGIDEDILFAVYFNHGALERMSFISIEDAERVNLSAIFCWARSLSIKAASQECSIWLHIQLILSRR